MLSSRTVGGHGVYRIERRFPEGPALLPEVLREAGWNTAAFTACDFVSGLFGLDRGFDHMEMAPEPAGRITARMAEYMLEHEDGPFFLFLHYYDVHQPFTEPNPYGTDFSAGLPEDELDQAWRIVDLLGRNPDELTEDEITWLAGLFPEQDVRGHIENARREGTMFDERLMKFVYRYLAEQGGEALEARKARYDNGVANMDMRLSELFEVLELFPWFEDTVFVITSDHGESFNEPAGIMGHGGPPYREQTHVPLIVFGRGIPAGVRITSPVASIDIAPTLLDLAGVQVPEEFQGLSLATAMQGGRVDERLILSGELQAGSVAVRSDQWTLLVGDGGSDNKLFDARETTRLDLSDQHPDVVEQLRGWLRGAEERNAVLTKGLDASDVLLDEEVRARLKELGYLR
jgi:arylsulfatase A-like enzyme